MPATNGCGPIDSAEHRRGQRQTQPQGSGSVSRHRTGSALECAAIQDVLLVTQGIKVQDDAALKSMLLRIVAMLTRMAMKFDGVAEPDTDYDAGVDYEHRFAEHEHEHEVRREETPEPCDATEPGLQGFTNGKSTVPAR